MILEIFIGILAVAFGVAYALRDKTQDAHKEQQFTRSITGGSLDNTRKTQ